MLTYFPIQNRNLFLIHFNIFNNFFNKKTINKLRKSSKIYYKTYLQQNKMIFYYNLKIVIKNIKILDSYSKYTHSMVDKLFQSILS